MDKEKATTENQLTDNMNQLDIQSTTRRLSNNNNYEAVEDAANTDSSDEYLSEPLRYFNTYQSLSYSISSNNSNVTMVPDDNNSYISCRSSISLQNIQVPIVGYEIMEERARFTVFKLRIENKISGDCWYVFRRYTDFARLCNRLRISHPDIIKYLPRKRWLGNNFDPVFLEDRVSGLQTLVNAILQDTNLATSDEVQDFFCFNEPPIYSETNEESRAIFESLEETITDLKQKLTEKEKLVDSLRDSLHSTALENSNLKKVIRSTMANCGKCQKECEDFKALQ